MHTYMYICIHIYTYTIIYVYMKADVGRERREGGVEGLEGDHAPGRADEAAEGQRECADVGPDVDGDMARLHDPLPHLHLSDSNQ